MSEKKPNIILLFNDHQAFHGHGQLGIGPKIKKPNFERLANEGVEFTQAYTACPLCGPARRSILTGLFPHNHGEIKNESNEDYRNELYLNTLARNGYENYYFGKWHAGRGTALDFNCKGFSCKGYGNPYTTKEYDEYRKRNELPFIQVEIQKSFQDPISNVIGLKEGELYEPRFPAYSEYATGIMTTPKETHEAYFLIDMACNTLRNIAKRANSKPFHMRVDFWGPHEPYFSTQEFIDLYNADDIPEHPNFIDNLDDKPELYKKQVGDLLAKDNQLILPNPLPWSEWQKVLAINYAEQTLIDEAGGILLNTLEELGLSENTVLMWGTDHGDALACHGGHFDKDAYMAQEVVRVPLAIRYPDVIPSGQKSEKLVSTLDFGPTFLDAAGLKYSSPVDGRSLLPLCKDPTIEWRKDLMCETHGHFTTIVGRMIVDDRYKYVYNEGYMDEFYDLKKDPFELKNLIKSNQHSNVLNSLKERLRIWRKKTGDNVSFSDIRGKRLTNFH
ncbi:MAG: sulfatase-like hydrolase/transferase [Candidatus Lokiarchaeota archaeon]|nr:sulfatase-like hydrolase/transferase [Candidatus Lokiarchaeota archaeon]MBD3337493.1 sulfatase-like hydrolase/transferase [Candidatus Lokiarchaeota archaeon]